MRTIEYANAFKKDFKRIKATPRHRQDVELLLTAVLILLADDQVLPVHQRDHDLTGNWSGYRECHLKPDLLLIYRKPEIDTLRLARLGSHSALFG
ncbi:type II toxin-antitoxin system YafQ family toxin [Sphaerotilus sp.]|jgi:mRNA interferase YafQ|uniref:type II toxin-antitoxin system YafQ family toxin n=1 Tax=Sphaerotilus sp. TaxID=2093942 RepID=UPI00286E94AC|nr:type II toxin-antitoxin system YafQ family toxin [Sphaerotilus sp.]